MNQHKVIIDTLNDLSQTVLQEVDYNLILNHISLKNSKKQESNLERESVEISVGTDNNAKASSFKLYNILHFNQNDFRASILGIIGAVSGSIFSNSAVATTMGILGLIGTFLEAGKKDYDEQDANVLLSIYRLGMNCHISTIPAEYKLSFGKEISDKRLQASLIVLARFGTIELRDEEVIIIEDVNIKH